MSNQTVGTVYKAIIDDVIDSSRIDFEEGGVEPGVLEALQEGWQRKLTQFGVAAFPWDPKLDNPHVNNVVPAVPAPAPPPPPPSLAAPIASFSQAQLSPQQNAQPLSLPGALAQEHGSGVHIKPEPGLSNEPAIKQEPGLANGMSPVPASAVFPNAPARHGIAVAQQRAAQALENQYGQRAAASISAIHSGMVQPVPGNPPQAQQAPRLDQVPMNAQQYRQGVAAQMAAQQQRVQANGQQGLSTSQVDGAGDGYEGVLMQRDAGGNPVEMGRVAIDDLLHAQIASQAKQMEGGGLMLPLKEATKHRSLAREKRQGAGASQVDGLEDDVKDVDVDDEAINSDLDDPEDDQDEDEDDDESMGHIMLCMYDKVQRVKNKWKCTLKDGVLTVNGKDYIFHKATGEYEW